MPEELRKLKRRGFSDRRIADLIGVKEKIVRTARHKENIRPVFKRVDSCAAEFASNTAYLYSTYEEFCEADPTDRQKIMILGGGPNRIGQGIEFDYCCVHASFALKEAGYETIMVNCNPETVSTDYDSSDRLYFEPVTLEDVLEIVHKEKPKGVIVQYGGQTPLKLARALEEAGVPIIGTSPDSIDLAEDRERFQQLVTRLKLKQPPNRTARNVEEAVAMGKEVGYPLVVRPSYVLGGRAMEIVHGEDELRDYVDRAVSVSNDSPILLDRFLDLAVEVDVDAICDGKEVIIGGIMEHVEQAGIHSGDSGCSLPPFSLSAEMQKTLSDQVRQMAQALQVNGIMNTQFAIQNGIVYVLEVNPRASRTIPFVSKAIGQPLAKIAAKAMAGITFKEQGFTAPGKRPYFSVKESVFPFIKFPDADPILGPEMKSTGEVMGTGRTFGEAYAKAQFASGVVLPRRGLAFISVRDRDKPGAVELGKKLIARGFEIVATGGTAKALKDGGVPCQRVNKVREGPAARRRHDQEPRAQLDRQHDRGQASDQGVALDSRRGGDAQGHVLHDRGRGEGDVRRSRPPRQRRRESAAGSARGGVGLSKVPLTARGAAQLKEELRRLKIRRAPEGHGGDRDGARARRSQGERGVSRGEGAARADGSAHPRHRGEARERADHRRHGGQRRRQGRLRRDRASRRRRRRQRGEVPDRRRGRGRHQERLAVDRLADRAGADRQARRRRGRGVDAERQARPTRSRPSSTSEATAVRCHDARVRASVGGSGRSATSTSSRPIARAGARAPSSSSSRSRPKSNCCVSGSVCVDLGSAPGSWSQLAARLVGPAGRVVAVDLLPMERDPRRRFPRGRFHGARDVAGAAGPRRADNPSIL